MSSNATLYDHPGPKAKRRDVIYNLVLSVVFVALGWWLVTRAVDRGIFDDRWQVLWDPPGFEPSVIWNSLLRGLWGTIVPVLISVPIVALLATVLTILRRAPYALSRWPSIVFIEVFRGLPVLLVMLFGVLVFKFEPLVAVVLGLVLYNTAVVAEILRAGIAALPSGQEEAGLSIGLSRLQTLLRIQLPQAVRIMLPALVSQIVVLLKDTALGFIIAHRELLNQVKRNYNFFGEETIVVFVIVGAVIYIIVNTLVAQLAAWIEKRLSRSRRAVGDLTGDDHDPAGAPPPSRVGGIEGVIRTSHVQPPPPGSKEIELPRPHLPRKRGKKT